MDLPAVVRVVSCDWQLVQCDPGELGEDLGTCEPDALRIRVARWLPPARLREVLLHELLHAVHHEMGLMDGCEEEEYADRGARGLLCLLKDNPWLLELLRS